MKHGLILIAAMALLGVISFFVVTAPEDDGEYEREGERLRLTLEADLNKKIYDYAYNDYSALSAHYPDDVSIIEDYRKFCYENGYPDKYIALSKELIKRNPEDPRIPNELADYYLRTDNNDIYNFIHSEEDKLSVENFAHLAEIYDNIRGRYSSKQLKLISASESHEDYSFGLNDKGSACILNAETEVIYKNPDSQIFAFSPESQYASVIDEDQLVYENISGLRRIVPYDGEKKELLYYKYLGSYTGTISNVCNENGVWGYMDTNGNTAYMEYTYTTPFESSVSAVQKDGKWAFISRYTFGAITGYDFDDVYIDEYGFASSHNIAYVKKSGQNKWSLAVITDEAKEEGGSVKHNLTFNVVKENEFDSVRPFYEKGGAVCTNGRWFFIDKAGERMFDGDFADAYSFRNGRAAVSVSGKWGYVDPEGKFIIGPQFEEAFSFSSSGFAIVKASDLWFSIQLDEDKYK